MIDVRLASTPEELSNCLRLRWIVFVEEQGVRPSLEVDEHDKADAVHALAATKSIPCGTGRFVFSAPGVAKIGRMAVIDEVRRQGVGRALLAFLEGEARLRGARSFTLGAQVSARAFYEKAGYAATGPVFDDAGIPHLQMDKQA